MAPGCRRRRGPAPQKTVNRSQRRSRLMRSIGNKPPHLLFGFAFGFKRILEPFQHAVKRFGQAVNLPLTLHGRKSLRQVSGIRAFDRFDHLVQRVERPAQRQVQCNPRPWQVKPVRQNQRCRNRTASRGRVSNPSCGTPEGLFGLP